MRIAITNAERRLAYVVAQSVKENEIFSFHHPNKKGLLWYSKLPKKKNICDILPPLEKIKEKELKERVLYLHENFDFVFPISLESIFAIVNYGNNDFPSLVPSKKAFESLKDKEKTISIAEELGVPVPKTYIIRDENKLISLIENGDLTYPVVLKIKEEKLFNPNQRYRICNNLSDLIHAYRLLSKNASSLLAQEYVSGYGAGFSAIYDPNNNLHSFFMHKREVELMRTGGPSVVCSSIYSPLIKRYGTTILDYFEYSGVAMVEFKVTKNNVPVLMEVNPRFWGSLPLAIKAGVNFPKIMLMLGTNRTVEKTTKYKKITLQFFYHHLFRKLTDFKLDHNPATLLTPILMLLNPQIYEGLFNFKDPISLLPIV